MKNFKRIVVLITLIFFVNKVLSSDFQVVKTKHKAAAVVNK